MDPSDIGKGKTHGGTPKGHDGHFQVTLRFGTETEARNAAIAATHKIQQEPGSGMYNLVLQARAIQRTEKQAEGMSPNPYAQVCVVW